MKRAFLCLAVVAMLVATANAANIQATTVGCWLFDEKAPGQTADGWPPTLGAIIDSAGGDNNGTAVGRLYSGPANPTPEQLLDPSNYSPTNMPVYDNGCANDPLGSSIRLNYWADNESADMWHPMTLDMQSRIECPANGDANWDLMLADGGVSYTIEAVIKPEARGVDETGNAALADRADFYEGIVADHKLNRPSGGGGSGTAPAWLFRTTGNDNEAMQGLEFDYWAGGQNKYIDCSGTVNLLDGNWHHVAAVLESTGPGTGVWKLYADGVLLGSKNQTGMIDVQPVDDYPPPYDNVTTDALWIGDFLGRWDDQFIGKIDGVAFSRAALGPDNFVLAVPEPSSIVLLIMGALALVAIRRAR